MPLSQTGIDNFVELAKAWEMRAFAWNPLTGCDGKGCVIGLKNCWAARMSKRYGRSFEPLFHRDRLEALKKRRVPSIIVCNYMGDPFAFDPRYSTGRPDMGSLQELFEMQREMPQHIYFWLSKHPERFANFDIPKGTWLGTTVNLLYGYEWLRCGYPRKDNPRDKKYKRYAYFEPILEDWGTGETVNTMMGSLDWVIIGGFSRGTKVDGYVVQRNSIATVIEVARIWKVPVFCKDNLKGLFKDEFEKLPRECPPLPGGAEVSK